MKDKRIKLCAICGKMPEIEVFNYYGSKGTYNVYTCCADYTYINLNAWNELQSSINKKIKKSKQEGYNQGIDDVLFLLSTMFGVDKLVEEIKKLKGDENEYI